jgi:hypothetical protein
MVKSLFWWTTMSMSQQRTYFSSMGMSTLMRLSTGSSESNRSASASCGTPTKRRHFKTSGFKTSGFKTYGFKTSGLKTSCLQNVRFQNNRFQNVWFQNVRLQNVLFTTERQVYKMSGLQNVQFLNLLYLLNKKYRNCQVCIPN